MQSLVILLLSAPTKAQLTCSDVKATYLNQGCCGAAPTTTVQTECPTIATLVHASKFAVTMGSVEFAAKVANDYAQVIDVRNTSEFAGGHIPKSINCPLLTSMSPPTPDTNFLPCVATNAVKNIPTIFMCDSGNRATLASYFVKSAQILVSDIITFKPGGVSSLIGYPLSTEYAMNLAGARTELPKLYNHYIAPSTTIAMLAKLAANNEPYLMIDVRSEYEFVSAPPYNATGVTKYTGSENIPLCVHHPFVGEECSVSTDPATGQLSLVGVNAGFVSNLKSYLSDNVVGDMPIFLYCGSGERSVAALTLLWANIRENPATAGYNVYAVTLGGLPHFKVSDPAQKGGTMQTAIFEANYNMPLSAEQTTAMGMPTGSMFRDLYGISAATANFWTSVNAMISMLLG